ncbi:MAG TPA: carotenoid biosynthesis protein [Bryobacteraceae bacterium]|jgi:putative membrane protein|nr:carotenoid biosynthesis protein [Bryobacteraceae bacterium]
MLVIVSLHVIPAALFALWHGAAAYSLRGMAVFVDICLAVGNGFENLSILTGFPFGHYYFTGLMGPGLLRVPIFLGLAYMGMGDVSWTLGRLLVAGTRPRLAGSQIVTVPLAAGFVMVAWDLSMDPIWSTVMRAWIWLRGGAYFGVTVSNFLGWYLTVYVIYQLFAIYLRKRASDGGPVTAGHWCLAVVFYGVSALGNLVLLADGGSTVATDATGAVWKVSSIVAASALVSILVMGAFALLAWTAIDR